MDRYKVTFTKNLTVGSYLIEVDSRKRPKGKVTQPQTTNLSEAELSPREKKEEERAKQKRKYRREWNLQDAVRVARTLEGKKEAAGRLEKFNGTGYSYLEYTLGNKIWRHLKEIINDFSVKKGEGSPNGFVPPRPNPIEADAEKKLAHFALKTISHDFDFTFNGNGRPYMIKKFPHLLRSDSKQPSIIHIDKLDLPAKLERVEALFEIVFPSRDTSLEVRIDIAKRYRALGGDPGWVTYLEEAAKKSEEERAQKQERIRIEALKTSYEEEPYQDIGTDIKVLPFEVLPPGFLDSSEYYKVFGLSQPGSQAKLEKEREERLRFVESLGDHAQYMGSNEIGSKYIVFVFESHVVAECPMEGNAVYVIKGLDNWQNMLRHSKRDLLRGHPDRVRKIIHKTDWQTRLKRALS